MEIQSTLDFRDKTKVSLFFDQHHPNGNLHRHLSIRSIPKTITTHTIESTGLGNDLEGIIVSYDLLAEDGIKLLNYYLYDPELSNSSQVTITLIDEKNALIEGSFDLHLVELNTKETIGISGQFSAALPQ